MSNYVKQTNTTNNYLDLVISELKNFPENNSEILNLIQSKKNVFNRFKRNFINNIDSIKSQKLKAFALLAASTIQDDDFLNTISKKFDYDLINNDLATFAKGIYNLYLKNYEQATNLLWNVFTRNKKYFCRDDVIHLIQLLDKFYFYEQKNIVLKYYLDNFNQGVVDYYNFANKYCDYYGADNFFKCYEKAIMNLHYTPTGHDFANQIITGWEGESTYEANYMLSLLNKVVDSLENIGEKPFLNGGTLLGMYRDGKLIDYDCDADIAILMKDRNNLDEYIQKLLQTILKDNNNLDYYIGHFPGEVNHYSAIVFADKTSKLHIDLAFMYDDNYFEDNPNKKYYIGFFTSMSPMFFSFDKFSLVRKKFCGKDYWIPDNSEHYLEQLYSKDWKKPLKRWNTFISAPNLSTKCKLSAFYFTLPAFLSALSKNNYEESLYYYEEFQRWDYPFTDEMKNHIENYLQQIKANQK